MAVAVAVDFEGLLAVGLLGLGTAFGATRLAFPVLLRWLCRVGWTGRDLHKPGTPELPESGGIGIVLGLIIGVGSGTVALQRTLPPDELQGALLLLGASMLTIVVTAGFGLWDDRRGLGRAAKVLVPALAALPLSAAAADLGRSQLLIPFLGPIEFGALYPFLLIPLGATGAVNAVNMLAGFNGLEVGVGLVALGSLAIVAFDQGSVPALVLLFAGIGAISAVLPFNWYPAKALLGNVGTFAIGSLLAAASVVGKVEVAGLLVLAPHFVDLVFKALHSFPSTGWEGELRDERLFCPHNRPVSLCQWLMKRAGGIHERSLVLRLLVMEAFAGAAAVNLYFFS